MKCRAWRVMYHYFPLSYAAIFWGSHSGLKRRTRRADAELTEIAPQVAHRRLLGTVILGPAKE